MNNNNISDKAYQKLLKLKELSERGVGGEAINAKNILNKYLIKYNISLEELLKNKEKVKLYKIIYHSKEEKSLLIQCVSYLFGSLSNQFKSMYRFTNGKMVFYIKLSNIDFILLKDLFDFHKEEYIKKKKELEKNLFYAYIENQKLYDKDSSKREKDHTLKTETNKNKLDIFSILQMADSLNVDHYCKRLKNE